MLRNKWNHGIVEFVLPPLSPIILQSSGLKPISMIVDERVGPEIVLLISEARAQANQFKGRQITGFFTKCGLANTSFGPIFWMFFYFPDPVTGQRVIYATVANPKDEEQLTVYEQIAMQEYWHIVIADDRGDVINFFEFPNVYGLSEALEDVRHTCFALDVSDFHEAKAEYQKKFSIDALLNE